MNKEQHKTRMYGISALIKKAIKAQRIQGHETLYCSAFLSRRGKKLNGIDRAAPENFTRLMLDFVAAEEPDKLRIELRGESHEILWSKTYQLEVEDDIQIPSVEAFRGLGQADVTDLVNQKLQEIRRNDELDQLRGLKDELQEENIQLKSQLQELEGVVEAKKNIEYYSNIIGLALPGLAKMLNKTPMGSTLGMLAGLQDPDSQSQNQENSSAEKSQRDTIIELITEFLQGLDDAQLGHLYLVFVELSNNPDLISSLLSNLNQKTPAA